MPSGLIRCHTSGDLHFITFSCVRKRPILGTAEARDTFLRILEQTRQAYRFHILGYVVMPDHVHLLLSEPQIGLISTVMQVIKQRFSRSRTQEYVWEPRYHDFNVKTEHKRAEKLHYIHQNPVKRGLTNQPGDWPWDSFHAYTHATPALVQLTRHWLCPDRLLQ